MIKILLFLIITPLLLIPSFAQTENTFFIITDKAKYYENETVLIMGEVSQILDEDLFLTFRSQIDNAYVGMLHTTINTEKYFIIETNTAESIITDMGNYTITANYDGESAETTFEYIDELAPYNPLTIQIDSEYFYNNQNVIVTGSIIDVDSTKDTTINYNIMNPFGETLESGSYDILEDDGTFELIIPTTELYEFGFTKVSITIQGYTASEYFYYSDEIDMTNETLYEMAMTHDTKITDHDIMLYYHDSMMVQYNDVLSAQNNTITLQQLEINDLKNDLAVVGGYLINLNVTLGVDFPPILNENAIKEVNKEIQRLEDEIGNGDILISDTLIDLEIAKAGDEPDKIIKLTEALGSAILSREIAQSKLNMIFLYLEIYPQ